MNLIRISESTNPFSWAVSCKISHCTLFIYQLFPVTIICQCLKSVKSFYSDVITFSAWGFVFQASSLPAQIRDLQISDIWSNSQYSVNCLSQTKDWYWYFLNPCFKSNFFTLWANVEFIEGTMMWPETMNHPSLFCWALQISI